MWTVIEHPQGWVISRIRMDPDELVTGLMDQGFSMSVRLRQELATYVTCWGRMDKAQTKLWERSKG